MMLRWLSLSPLCRRFHYFLSFSAATLFRHFHYFADISFHFRFAAIILPRHAARYAIICRYCCRLHCRVADERRFR
jgi:hypothetical protein